MSESNPNSHLVAKSGFFTGLHPGMGTAAKGMIAFFVIFTVLNVDLAGGLYKSVRAWIEGWFSWYYISLLIGVMFFCFWLMVSKFGKLRLGDDDSRPEFGNFSWFAMLFSAGIGVGILFFGVAEPIFYFDNSGAFGYPNNPHADMVGHMEMDMLRARDAMRVAFFHWGFHGWALYVLVGLCLAYFGFRKKLPLTMRSTLYPILGERIYGPWGHLVDLLAVFGSVFGIATSLGLGSTQIATGLNVLFGLEVTLTLKIVLIVIVSVIATASTVSGVARGIRFISEWNIWLSIALLLAFVVLGPGKWLMAFFITSLGDYLWNFIPMGFWTATEAPNVAWQGGWTIFYWGWWIAWAPLVGIFIARISYGRTIREFMVGVLCVPTVAVFFWLCMFGGTAIWQEMHMAGGPAAEGGAGIIATVRNWELPGALYGTIANIGQTSWMGDMSWTAWPLSLLATVLLVSWFVTSADSGTLVITTMLSMGDENPPNKFRIIWGVGIGATAIALLMSGGLNALQTALIATAFPISFLIMAMVWGLCKSLREDPTAAPMEAEQAETPDGTHLTQDLTA
ncbi:BCCT family transporter [Leisingera daeponensis]|uniref:BCCT family transporter n=1 Tax=Leisingera daeponensis TaxID=405746 RepID=A0ABS7NM24_9RHOB|nr:BCCT family transporter [Leisingera daeponensis]MBY6142248.1 BCCT family transporter [Leisingera daeponensis]